jgi:hypothetical protein
VGLPNEALAMVDAAAAREAPKRSPLLWNARLLIVRAQAQGALNRWSDAERLASSAAAMEPMLAPHAAGLQSVASLCRNDRPAAVSRRKRSRKLQDPPPDPPIDESQGRASDIRNIPFPALPAQAAAFYRTYDQQRLSAELMANLQRGEELRRAEAPDPAHPAARARTRGLLARANAVKQRPAIAATKGRFDARLGESHTIRRQMFGDGQLGGRYGELSREATQACEGSGDFDACYRNEMRQRCGPVLRDHHHAWLNAITAAYAEAGEWQRQVSLAHSAIAAHFSDPARYEGMLHRSVLDEHAIVSSIIQSVYFWTDRARVVEDHCIVSPEPPGAPEAGATPAPQGSGPCPKALQNVTRTIDIAEGRTRAMSPWSVGATVDCDKVALEASVEPIPWIKGFGAVEHAWRSGETTLVAGSKAEISKGPVKGGFESALYVRFDRGGKVTDAGWRVGPSAAVGTGLVEYGGGNVLEMSFFNGPDPGALPTFAGD